MSTNTALDQIKNRVEGHTEGPWEVMTHSVCRERNKIWHRVATNTYGPTAELIAAAPKLLAALEAVEARLAAWQEQAVGMSAEDCTTRALAFLLHNTIEEALR